MIDTGRTVSVLGKTYPVMLTDGDDYQAMKFYVDLGEANELQASSYRELRTLASEYKDVRFNLPFTTMHGVNGSITGFHAGNGNMLIRWANGATSQESDYRLNASMPRLSEADHKELVRLIDANEAAKAAWDQFVQTRKFPDGAKAAAIEARARKAGLA